MRSAADLDTPKSGASWRIVKFVRQYAATSRARSSSGRLHGRPLRTASAPSRRSAVTSLPNRRGLPENGAIQDGSDAVITPATPRSSPVVEWLWAMSRGIRWRETALAPRIAGCLK